MHNLELYTLSATDFDHYFGKFCTEQARPTLPLWHVELHSGTPLSLHILYEAWVSAQGPPITNDNGWLEVAAQVTSDTSTCGELQQVYATWLQGFPEYMMKLVQEWYEGEAADGMNGQAKQEASEAAQLQAVEGHAGSSGTADAMDMDGQQAVPGSKRGATGAMPPPKRQQQQVHVHYQYTFGPNGIEYVDANAAKDSNGTVQPQIMAVLTGTSRMAPPIARKKKRGPAAGAAKQRAPSPEVAVREPRQPRLKREKKEKAAAPERAPRNRREPPHVDDPVPGNPIRSMMAFIRIASLNLPGATGRHKLDPDAVPKMASLARRYRERFGRLAYATRTPLPDDLLPVFCGVGPSRRSQRTRSHPAFFHPDWTNLAVLQRRSSAQQAICEGPHYQAVIPPLRVRPQQPPPDESRWQGTLLYKPDDAAMADGAQPAAAAAKAAVEAARPLRMAESGDRRRVLLQMELERADAEMGDAAESLGLGRLGPLKGRTSWSPEDEAAFALGMLRYGRHFKRVHRHLLRQRPVGELVDYYYNVWKMLGAPLAVMWASEDWMEREPEEWEATVRSVLADVTDGKATLPPLPNARARAAARSPSRSRSLSPTPPAPEKPAPKPRGRPPKKKPAADKAAADKPAAASRDPRRAAPPPPSPPASDSEPEARAAYSSSSGGAPDSDATPAAKASGSGRGAARNGNAPLRNPNRVTKLTPAQSAANDRRALKTLVDWVRLVGKGVDGGNPKGYQAKTQKRRAEVARNARLDPELAALAAAELPNASAAAAAAAAAAAVAGVSAGKAARGKRRTSEGVEPAGAAVGAPRVSARAATRKTVPDMVYL